MQHDLYVNPNERLRRAYPLLLPWPLRDAERRREMDQHRGRGPKNYKRSDERIREDVCDRLSDDGMVDASEIEVKVSGAEVTLDGTVTTVERTLWSSHHGPMVNLPLLGWGTEVSFSLRDTNTDNVDLVAQFLGMNLARSLDEFQEVFATVKGLPWVNTLAADRTGRAWYIDGSATPNISPAAGWAEADPEAWWAALVAGAAALQEIAPAAFAATAAMAIAGFTRTQVLVGTDHRPLRPAILWSDRRAWSDATSRHSRPGRWRCRRGRCRGACAGASGG